QIKPYRVSEIDCMRNALAAALHLRLNVVIDELPPAAFDASQRRSGTVIGETLGPEAAPVVGDNLVQGVNDIIEGVSLHHRPRVGSAVEEPAEIVQRFLACALLADDDLGPQPVQQIFFVEIYTTPPGVPSLRREIELWSGIGGVLQVAPGAAGSMVERGGG